MTSSHKLRHLVVVLGDQLDGQSAAFDGFDNTRDAILQMEVKEEASYIPQHRRRLVLFFAAMRHFRDEQRARGRQVTYSSLGDHANRGSLAAELQRHTRQLQPEQIIVLEPGDWRVRAQLADTALPIEFRADRHFLCSRDAFSEFADHHQNPVMETFYRFMRQQLGILIEDDGAPTGGKWNLDSENRESFGRRKAPPIPAPPHFTPDATTREVMALVQRTFPHNPGQLNDFDLPVNRAQAQQAVKDFLAHRLASFGRYQDAMRGGEAFLFHSRLSVPLNLHMLQPREVVDAALRQHHVPLNSLEGFIRQIIGWREFVHGIYWRLMPDYAECNVLGADLPMPRFFWTGETDMRCLHEAIRHTIDHAYAHHIERLMVLGQFCLLLGVRPYDVHRWHLSMFVDAIDWVSLPNTLGMSQHADGGVIGTKPYAASGNYINRMSDHCAHCRYDPHKSVGEDACPFTTLYWDFLARHTKRFRSNRRMAFQYRNLGRKDRHEVSAIRRQANSLKSQLTVETFL
jgi:deoxyribodipyrimidine photolyase-related protein